MCRSMVLCVMMVRMNWGMMILDLRTLRERGMCWDEGGVYMGVWWGGGCVTVWMVVGREGWCVTVSMGCLGRGEWMGAHVNIASRPGRGRGKSGLGNTVTLAESALPEKVVIGYFQYTTVTLVSACLRTIVLREL